MLIQPRAEARASFWVALQKILPTRGMLSFGLTLGKATMRWIHMTTEQQQES
jgi:hypothetical protein